MQLLALRSFLVPADDPDSGSRRPRPALTGVERRALHLVEVEGASYHEAAARLGLRRDDVKELVFHSRQKLLLAVGAAVTRPATR